VTAERPFENPPTRGGRVRGLVFAPIKRVLRKLMRWYVEPVAAHQRTFNSASLALVDELAERTAAEVARLERRIDALEERLDRDRRNPSG
jgi:ubiquinone biosynthesis protein UbiJ